MCHYHFDTEDSSAFSSTDLQRTCSYPLWILWEVKYMACFWGRSLQDPGVPHQQGEQSQDLSIRRRLGGEVQESWFECARSWSLCARDISHAHIALKAMVGKAQKEQETDSSQYFREQQLKQVTGSYLHSWHTRQRLCRWDACFCGL